MAHLLLSPEGMARLPQKLHGVPAAEGIANLPGSAPSLVGSKPPDDFRPVRSRRHLLTRISLLWNEIHAFQADLAGIGRERHEYLYLIKALSRRLEAVEAAVDSTARHRRSRSLESQHAELEDTLLDIDRNLNRVAVVFRNRLPNLSRVGFHAAAPRDVEMRKAEV